MVAAIVLAAGGGERFGGPRALVRVDGELLVDRAVAAATGAGCDPVVVVLGMADEQVRSQAKLDGVRVLRDPAWRTGAGSALRLALDALAEVDTPAALVLVAHTPGVTGAAVARLVEQADSSSLRAASYAGRRGHPVLLGRDHWPGVAVLATGDVGERAYLSAHADILRLVPCEDIADGAEHEPSPA